MIVILDYDMGNVGSIKNMYHHIGIDDAYISRDIDLINKATHIILPGVGSFDTGMDNLERYSLIDVIYNNVINKGKPILGICLGMQLLGNGSEEGKKEGLRLIDFNSVKFDVEKMSENKLKIPHMGWDFVEVQNNKSTITNGMEAKQRFYFVHSYHALCSNKENVLMSCDYGYDFAAAVIKENIIGVQFHPEKSHKFGMNLLKNFAELRGGC